MMTALLTEWRAPAVQSHGLGTFHIGDERDWEGENSPSVVEEWATTHPGRERELAYLAFCPYLVQAYSSPGNLQNHIECGKNFRPRRREASGDGRLVPNFVRPGYERLFWENHGKLKYATRED